MQVRSFLAACAALALAGGIRCAEASGGPPPGAGAPDFSLKDLSGSTVKLSDLKGKVVLLNFSTTWCPHCRTAVPQLKEIEARYKDREFVLLSIYIQESQRKVSAFAAKYGVSYRVLLDEDGSVARAYGVRGIPSRTVVGRDGLIVCRDCRDVDKDLEKAMGAGK